ncbi:MAG: exonuclease domain-containing protein [Clostridia bacterium]|nr:exonuclease domain-containing protein [Clostridia bacterium]
MIDTYVAIDLETTGTNPATDRIIEIGAARVQNGNITDTFSTFVNPEIPISTRITQITGISDKDVKDAPVIKDIIGEILEYTRDMPILGHNVIFDYSFIKKAAVDNRLTFLRSGIDTLKIARRVLPDLPHKNLPVLCGYFGINPGNSHRALDDAISASNVYRALYEVKPDDEGFERALPLNYSVKRDTPITPAQKSYLTALVTYHRVQIEQPIESMTKSQASRMIDSIISEKGRILNRPAY